MLNSHSINAILTSLSSGRENQ